MARCLSNVKLLATFASDAASVINRRNYSAQGVISKAARGGNRGVMKKGEDKQMNDGGKCAWMPDPVTGYYLPENRVGEIDASELRETFLIQRSRASIRQV